MPLTKATRGMIGAEEFGMMKRGVILINVSRGKVVNTDALVAALDSGRVAAAGLDVTDPEPLPKGHPLWSTPGVLITPHVGGGTEGWQRRAFAMVEAQVRRFVAGEPLVNVVAGPGS